MIRKAKSSASLNRQRDEGRQRSSTMKSLENFNITSLDRDRSGSDTDAPVLESPTYLSSEILNRISLGKDAPYILAQGNQLVTLLNDNPTLRNELMINSLINKILFMFCHSVLEVRALGYKILRAVISNVDSLSVIVYHRVLVFLVISLSTTQPSLEEKIQALKLIRQFISVPKGTSMLSIGVIKALVSICESEDQHITQNFKHYCLETLCEVALYKPELVFHSDRFTTIINTMLTGTVGISICCLLVIISLLDRRDSRKYLRNGLDLGTLISDFDNTIKVPLARLQKNAFQISVLLKSYNGLMAFSVNNFEILRSFLACLKNKNDVLRELILDILFDALRIRVLPWLKESSVGSYIKKHMSLLNQHPSFEFSQLDSLSVEHRFVMHYRGLLTMILINNDLIPILDDIVRQPSSEVSEKAALLMSQILLFTSHLLPKEFVESGILLPISRIDDPTSSIITIGSLAKQNVVTQEGRKVDPDLKNNLKQIGTESRFNLDDFEFKMLITATKVLAIKEFEDWNWSAILKIIEGPLTNPRRFDELLEKNPKFMKRLMSFYRPFKFRFCKISKIPSSRHREIHKTTTYTEVGCRLIEALISFSKGTRFLSQNKLLPQILEIFAQVDPFSGIAAREPILSKKRLENTLSAGYLQFIGILSTKHSGLKMLEQWQFFNIFHDIIECTATSSSNNYLVQGLFRHLDFSLESHLRIILAKSINTSNIRLRTYLLERVISKLIRQKETETFSVKLLVNLLYDHDKIIFDKAVSILNDYFIVKDSNIVEYFVKLKPPVSLLSKTLQGKNLLVLCLKSPKGFKYLEETGFVALESEFWFDQENIRHLGVIELMISSSLLPVGPKKKLVFNGDDYSVNFIKHLLSTEEGLNYFNNSRQKVYLERIINYIEQCAEFLLLTENDTIEGITENDTGFNFDINSLKWKLWTMGIIGSSEYGIQLLDPVYNTTLSKSIIKVILDLFETCPIWMVRNTCFYVIGMISSTTEGVEILDEMKWVSVIDEFSKPKGYAYPKPILSNDFLKIQRVNPYRVAYVNYKSNTEELNSIEEDIEEISMAKFERIGEKVLIIIKYLTSVLGRIRRKATRELVKLKKTNPEIFSNQSLFLEVIKLVDEGNFKFENRTFVFDLFLDNTNVLESLMKKRK